MKQLFSIRDIKASLYAAPFAARTTAEAVRMFTQAVNDKNQENMLNKYPGDYNLVYVGQFDEESGKITDTDPKHIIEGTNVKEKSE